MADLGYDYHGLVAETWDLSRDDSGNWPDRQLYLDLAREYGEPVLDVGCGTGRIVLDFLQLGIDCDGVDNSPEMLEICRKKSAAHGLAPNLYLQPMEALDLPRRYQMILVPSSTLQLVIDMRAVEETVRRLMRHLLPGGALASPFSFMPARDEPPETDWQLGFERVRPEDGATVRRWSRGQYHPDDQLWDSEDRFEVVMDGEVIATEAHRRCPEGRWYTQTQAVDLFRRAGFDDIKLLSGFTREPAIEDDTLFTVVAVAR
jgi:SAM-dependent methyltransferase